MRKLIGTICIILGSVCLTCAIGFVIYNHWEAENATEITQSLLENVHLAIDEEIQPPQSTEMPTIKVDGYDCIGILSIPALELELPVLTDWSYTKLKKAPCLYYGNYHESNFVIAAHNYKAHFGKLSHLVPGDVVTFTDVCGTTYYYDVVLLETLPKVATYEMITSGFDLSLYTCTTNGTNRVTVRCNLKETIK